MGVKKAEAKDLKQSWARFPKSSALQSYNTYTQITLTYVLALGDRIYRFFRASEVGRFPCFYVF